MATTPEPNWRLASSTSPRRSFGATPCSVRAKQLHRTEVADGGRGVACRTAAERELALGVGQLLLELPPLVEDGGEPLDHLVGGDLEQLRRLAHALHPASAR